MKSTWTGGLNQTEGAKHWQCAIINDCHGEYGTGDYFSTYCIVLHHQRFGKCVEISLLKAYF